MVLNAAQGLGQTLEQEMSKRKRDKLANELLNERDPPRAGTADGRIPTEKPHTGGYDAYRLRRELEDDELTRRLREAQIRKADRERSTRGRSGAPLVDTPFGQMTPAQWAREERMRNKPPGSSREEKRLWQLEGKFNEDLIAAGGFTLSDVPNIKNQRLINTDGTPYDSADPLASEPLFAGEVQLPGGQTKSFQIPKKEADELMRRFDGLQRYKNQFGQGGGGYSTPRNSSSRSLTGKDAEAAQWAEENPDDPRAAEIMRRLGVFH